jgi:thiamine biosynthesis protein ThiS
MSAASPRTESIRIVVNGQARTAPVGLTLLGLLGWLEVDPARVAVELNRAIVSKTEWANILVEAESTLEIVQFVGGG